MTRKKKKKRFGYFGLAAAPQDSVGVLLESGDVNVAVDVGKEGENKRRAALQQLREMQRIVRVHARLVLL